MPLGCFLHLAAEVVVWGVSWLGREWLAWAAVPGVGWRKLVRVMIRVMSRAKFPLFQPRQDRTANRKSISNTPELTDLGVSARCYNVCFIVRGWQSP